MFITSPKGKFAIQKKKQVFLKWKNFFCSVDVKNPKKKQNVPEKIHRNLKKFLGIFEEAKKFKKKKFWGFLSIPLSSKGKVSFNFLPEFLQLPLQITTVP